MAQSIRDKAYQKCLDTLTKHIGSQIKQFRKKNGLKQKELSDLAGLTYRHLQTIEGGRSNPRLATITKIASALDVPTDQIFCTQKQEIEDLKNLFRIFDTINISIFMCDIGGKIIYSNPAHSNMTEFNALELLREKYIWDLVPENEISKIKNDLAWIVLNKPANEPYETIRVTKRLGDMPVRIHWNYIEIQNELIGFLCIVMPQGQDPTEMI